MAKSKNPNVLSYFDWLHALTLKGYEENPTLIIEAVHSEFIENCYYEGKSIEEALKLYKEKINK